MSDRVWVPPGWPAEVPPPGVPGFERRCAGYLRDQCPPEYRLYEVLQRHPVVLARFAAGHVRSAVDAARHGLATSRAELRDLVPPQAVEAAVAAYEREGLRLVQVLRAVELLEQALTGTRWAARL